MKLSSLILNLRSKLVNSVGKVKNKGVLGSKTWFLAPKWVKNDVLTTFGCRFGFRIKNWTSWLVGLKIFLHSRHLLHGDGVFEAVTLIKDSCDKVMVYLRQ